MKTDYSLDSMIKAVLLPAWAMRELHHGVPIGYRTMFAEINRSCPYTQTHTLPFSLSWSSHRHAKSYWILSGLSSRDVCTPLVSMIINDYHFCVFRRMRQWSSSAIGRVAWKSRRPSHLLKNMCASHICFWGKFNTLDVLYASHISVRRITRSRRNTRARSSVKLVPQPRKSALLILNIFRQPKRWQSVIIVTSALMYATLFKSL